MSDAESILDYIAPEEYFKQLFKLAFKNSNDLMKANDILTKFMRQFQKQHPRKIKETYNLALVANLVELANVLLKKHIENVAIEHFSVDLILK